MSTIDIQAFRKALPIYEYRERIEKSVKENDFCIVTGDTGSGKSTQLPQYMMDSSVVRQAIL
jgi:HrpA-like RNA helicase